MNKRLIYSIVFESDTKAGRRFDLYLLYTILLSVLVAMLDSLPGLSERLHYILYLFEWAFTLVFTLEYALRLYISRKPFRYVFSFWGIIDLLAILPTYLSFFFFGYQYLLIVRILRLMRVFRILRLFRFSSEAVGLLRALKAGSYKIGIFFSAVLLIVVMLGTIMYVVEQGENGFTSIPQSIYWAIITLTTVGYGDVVPTTVLGKMIASITMIIGYAIIAVPTGIVTGEIVRHNREKLICSRCEYANDKESNFCSHCGHKLTRD